MVINRIYIMQGDFMLLMCKNTPVYELDPDDFDEQTIMELFGKAGAQMLIIDAVIGNATGMPVISDGLEIRIQESM